MIGFGYKLTVLVLIVQLVVSWHDERAWSTIVDGQPSQRDFNPATFSRHPQQDGQLVRDAYAALYIDDETRELAFGQAKRESDGRICATFHLQGQTTIRSCTRFRVLVNLDRRTEFLLVKPENFNRERDEPVEYRKAQLVVAYDPETSSSYFGTLVKADGQEPVIYAVDYNGAPTEVRGKEATSGDYVLYVVDEK